MTIDILLGHSTEELAAMSDEQLLEKFRPVFDLEPKPEGIQLILEKPKKPRVPKDPNAPPKAKLSRTDKLKRQLEELNNLIGDDDEEEV